MGRVPHADYGGGPVSDAWLDEMAPAYLRDERIRVSLSPESRVAVGDSVIVLIDYSLAAPEGVKAPLLFTARSAGLLTRKELFTADESLVWVPEESGPHLLVVREAAHNRWFGRLRVTVD